jgi:hypothetical protein
MKPERCSLSADLNLVVNADIEAHSAPTKSAEYKNVLIERYIKQRDIFLAKYSEPEE